jgi:hypothetical protein
MNTPPQGPSDSLELLLDTVCNSLGSMILITLLIVVSTNDLQERLGQEKPEDVAAAHAQAQSLHDRINATRREAARLRSAAAGLIALKAEVATLKSKAASAQDPSSTATNPVMNRLKIADRTLREARQSIETKNTELAALKDAQQKHLSSQTQQVRLPSRQTSSKKAALVFVADGKFFPQMMNGKLSAHIDIEILRARPLYASIKPKLRKGLDLSEFKVFLRSLNAENERVGLLVYASGFEVFMQAQQACAERGLDCGWEPLAKGTVMTIGGSGQGIKVDPQ